MVYDKRLPIFIFLNTLSEFFMSMIASPQPEGSTSVTAYSQLYQEMLLRNCIFAYLITIFEQLCKKVCSSTTYLISTIAIFFHGPELFKGVLLYKLYMWSKLKFIFPIWESNYARAFLATNGDPYHKTTLPHDAAPKIFVRLGSAEVQLWRSATVF